MKYSQKENFKILSNAPLKWGIEIKNFVWKLILLWVGMFFFMCCLIEINYRRPKIVFLTIKHSVDW